MSRERVARVVLGAYKRVLSPVVHAFGGVGCRYLPTCSEYAYAAVVKHGWLHGGWLAFRRVGRCHPLRKGGFDPVP